MGLDAGSKLVQEFGGQSVEVLLGPVSDHRSQRRKIRELLAPDVPVFEIALGPDSPGRRPTAHFMETWEVYHPGQQAFSEREIRDDPFRRDLAGALID